MMHISGSRNHRFQETVPYMGSGFPSALLEAFHTSSRMVRLGAVPSGYYQACMQGIHVNGAASIHYTIAGVSRRNGQIDRSLEWGCLGGSPYSRKADPYPSAAGCDVPGDFPPHSSSYTTIRAIFRPDGPIPAPALHTHESSPAENHRRAS